MNKTFISGNLGRDAEIKTTDKGRQYLTFSVAVDDGKDTDGNRKTIWFNASSWSEGLINSNLKQYLTSGTKVIIVGKYVPTVWNRDVDGQSFPEVSHNILVNEIELCGSAGGQQTANPSNTNTPQDKPQVQRPSFNAGGNTPVSDDDDLPF